MDKEEGLGLGLIFGGIFLFVFFLSAVVIGYYRESQPDYLENIVLVDFLARNFRWQGVVLFLVSLGVYGILIYAMWVGYCLITGRVVEIEDEDEETSKILEEKERKEIIPLKERKPEKKIQPGEFDMGTF